MKRIVITDKEFLEILETAVIVSRDRKIKYCIGDCVSRIHDQGYCKQYCREKYMNNNYFTKADFIKAAAITDYLYKVKIETLLRKLRKYAASKRYIKYVDHKGGVYKLLKPIRVKA